MDHQKAAAEANGLAEPSHCTSKAVVAADGGQEGDIEDVELARLRLEIDISNGIDGMATTIIW